MARKKAPPIVQDSGRSDPPDAGLSQCVHCKVWHERAETSGNALTDEGPVFVCTDCWLDALSPGIVTHLPYGPVVREDGTFTMNTFDKIWHTLRDPACAECQYVDETWPRSCVTCGSLVHYQMLGPYMGDAANGYTVDWMCEVCGHVEMPDGT